MMALLMVALVAGPATAQTAPAVAPATVVSRDVDDVAVTVYRDPARGEGPINRAWPRGYALISETRSFDVPAGDFIVRFEGVAEGLLPETAVISGMPRGVREKNRDARLLSPAGLVDAFLKRSVTLRRTDRRTGVVREQQAVIQSGPMGGVIVQTAEGFEALGCSGLPERMLFDRVPSDLSPRPTLSILASADRAQRVTVQIVYLAEGFDWAANYVADVGPDGRRVDMIGWLTLVNGGITGFPDARLGVIAGQPNRVRRGARPRSIGGPLSLSCWPMDITSTHPAWQLFPVQQMDMMEEAQENIVVTGSRVSARAMAMAPPPPPPPPPAPAVVAEQEDVGDLKYYRVPVRVDVAAKGQKQVALVVRDRVAVEPLYAMTLGGPTGGPVPTTLRLRMMNRDADGLGVPLPAGQAAVFETVGDERILLGEASIGDKAIGERVDYDLANSPAVQVVAMPIGGSKPDRPGFRLSITNARPTPATVEVTIPLELRPRPTDMERRGNAWVWRVSVPAGGNVTRDFKS